MGSAHWSIDEKESLKVAYPNTPNEALGRIFGRSPRAIGLMARSLGIKKSDAYMKDHPTRLKPGGNPWNKGVKGSTGLQAGCRVTQFKPGRHPSESRNYRPIGSLRISKDGYLEQKVTDDPSVYPARRWVAVHRLVWEAENGQVPHGFIVVFKHGQSTADFDNVTIDRLECITRAENMRRNTYHRYGKEVAQLIQLRGVLSRQIRKRETEQQHEHQ